MLPVVWSVPARVVAKRFALRKIDISSTSPSPMTSWSRPGRYARPDGSGEGGLYDDVGTVRMLVGVTAATSWRSVANVASTTSPVLPGAPLSST